MNRSTTKRAVLVLLTAVGLASFAAQAGAHAVAISASGFRYVSVGADAAGGIGPCSDFAVGGGGVLTRVCFRTGAAGANVAYGSARAGAGDGVIRRVTFIRGVGTAGPGILALGDTTVVDSMDVVLTPSGPAQVQVVLNGLVRVQSPASRPTVTISKVLVYPTAAAANSDLSGTGAGAVFVGAIQITSNPGAVPVASYSGGFSSGDFVSDVSAGNTLNVRANGVIKNVAVATPAQAAVRSSSDSDTAISVPGPSAWKLALLGFALAGLGVVAVRRMRPVLAA